MNDYALAWSVDVCRTGDWSDKDTVRWTRRLQNKLGYTPSTAEREDGTFWMSFSDFCHHFEYVCDRLKLFTAVTMRYK